ncbi:efflux RND transporter permease subunit [Massilia oculi]|uniref:efflux RND transporter permease subunit n=1 Tax=Massilia oculi TaxID=945844 RepID=UPI0028B1D2F3|nr:efflux RND transporter permease subunit [Massilia oculi]
MNLATWSLQRPIPALLLFVLLSLAGLLSFQRLPIQNMPDIEQPEINILLAQPGAAPAQLETEVARKVEDALASLAGLKHSTTTIGDGMVHIRAEFVLEKPVSEALIETKDAVDRVRADLPSDLEPPSVSAASASSDPTVTYALASTRMDDEVLSWYVDDVVTRALLAVPGVARVVRQGGVEREVRVDADPVAMASLGVTVTDLSRALAAASGEASGGMSRLGAGEQAVRTVVTVRQAHELAALAIPLGDGRRVRLDQVATVSDGVAEQRSAALLDGRPVTSFAVYRARGADEVRMAEGVTAALHALAQDGMSFDLVAGSVDYTMEQYRGSMQMLVEGALLAVLVVWWFLRDWRATLVAAAALPLSILPTFLLMDWLGYTLNTLTLLAMAVVVGILVDDAIVEVENIARHRQMGKTVERATRDAVEEIALAVTATTATLVVVFIPTAMMSGVPGLFFRQFGWSTVVAVLASLLVARLLTPVMAARFLRGAPRHEPAGGRLMDTYLGAVRWCLARRSATITAALLLFAGSIALIPFIDTGLMPAADRGQVGIDVELAPGSTLSDTRLAAERARLAVAGIDGVKSVFASIGGAGSDLDAPVGGGVGNATLTLGLGPRGERPSQQAIEGAVRRALQDVPGARYGVGGAMGEQIELILASADVAALQATAAELERQLRGVPGLSNVRSSASVERPELVLRPDAARAAERGVSTPAIHETIRIATAGDTRARLPKLNLDARQVPVRVQMPHAQSQELEALGNLRVPADAGLVPLASVAALALENGPARIDRYDRQRHVTLRADLGSVSLGQAQAAAMALPAAQALPAGVQLLEGGDAEIAGELMTGFGGALVTGVICMYCVLVLLFGDFLQPFTILSALPLSLCGAFAMLLATGSELDVPSMIGLVMLMGIVAKNSILLVEYAVRGMRGQGLGLEAAVLAACRQRARPILMTSLAMVAGMLPIALGLGADASFRQPMAIAVIGGLLSSTLLSLLVVPAVFVTMGRLRRRPTVTHTAVATLGPETF